MAHSGVNDAAGLVHHVDCSAANVADATQADRLLDGEETVGGDSGDTGADKREERDSIATGFLITARPSQVGAITNRKVCGAAWWQTVNARLRAIIVVHPCRVIKRQFGDSKVRYRGLATNTGLVLTLFALSNLWIVRRHVVQ